MNFRGHAQNAKTRVFTTIEEEEELSTGRARKIEWFSKINFVCTDFKFLQIRMAIVSTSVFRGLETENRSGPVRLPVQSTVQTVTPKISLF